MRVIKHYGTPRRSGRYPWGSGQDPQRNLDFLSNVEKLKSEGMSEVEIAKGMGMTTSQLRAKKSLAKSEKRRADAALALRLKDKGMSNVAIGERMGINESSVRALLDPAIQARSDVTMATANMLRDAVENKKYIDIGSGVETHLGISRTKLNTAVSLLKEEGYVTHEVRIKQLGTGKSTTIKVLALPGTTELDAFKNRYDIHPINESYSQDGGRTWLGLEPITNIDSKRIHIRYAEDGGKLKDGVIELRRGVEDLNLGKSNYAQVRIGVDGTHFLKGMAIYSDNMPPGVDIIYNSNKTKDVPPEKVFKPMVRDKNGNIDPDNPFGSSVYQRKYIDADGKERVSALNIVAEEGKWSEWSKSLSSQVLSKQTPSLAKRQLEMALGLKKEEFDDINELTNPAVKKHLLESFADDCDAAAVHLKAAALPRQGTHVILPFSTIKEHEIYAPNYNDGETVVLIRHPHGGIFEIPSLVVNNKNPEARGLIGKAKDAVGIHPKVAEQLSGADFDGDTVLVIPNRDGYIKTSSPLRALKDFDPKVSYAGYPGMPVITNKTKQMKMGDVSNLITDMTIKGATEEEIARAVKHSMVVIDAEKHKLDYKRSYVENGIGALKTKYQGSEKSGASTLISRASSQERIPERKEGRFVIDPETGKKKRVFVDPATGEKLYEQTGGSFTKLVPDKRGRYAIDSEGKRVYLDTREKIVGRTTVSTKMAEKTDARELLSENGGTRIERIYADYANGLKALANQSRKMALGIENVKYSPTARITYSKEVESLDAKLKIAYRNKPLERQAQLLANRVVSEKRRANPMMDADDLKKVKSQALDEARHRVGSGKKKIEITDQEWEAIQAGAVSNNVLSQILLNTDMDSLKQRAMPRRTTSMSPARISRAKDMFKSGYNRGEIANALGVSLSVLEKALQ